MYKGSVVKEAGRGVRNHVNKGERAKASRKEEWKDGTRDKRAIEKGDA